ncbi:hypothetical protein TNCV_2754431 [Trichonephila clavipes]|nr:hypothetical protein TNCV_2754431 [Trichonephila clavipes]
MMIPAYNKKGCAAFLSRRESITGERPTSFPKKIQPCLTRDSNPNLTSRGSQPPYWLNRLLHLATSFDLTTLRTGCTEINFQGGGERCRGVIDKNSHFEICFKGSVNRKSLNTTVVVECGHGHEHTKRVVSSSPCATEDTQCRGNKIH